MSRLFYPVVSSILGLSILCSLGLSTKVQVDPTIEQVTRGQLAQLNPEKPVSYFYAGENLGAIARTDQQRDIASQALVVGANLAYQQGDSSLAASMCIAIAAIESDAQRSQDMWDLALILDRQRLNAWRTHRDKKYNEDTQARELAAKCLAAARYGDTKHASELYNQNAVREIINQTVQSIGLNESRVSQLIHDMLEHGDDECRGRVFVVERSDGEVQRVVCQDHRRPIGAADNEPALRDLLKIEHELVSMSPSHVAASPWSLSDFIGTTSAVHDPSLSGMLERYGVDTTMPYWKDNRWTSKR